MNRLLFFFIHKRLKGFYSAGNWRTLTGLAVITVSLLVYGIGAGFLYNLALAKNKLGFASGIINSIETLLFSMPILLKFFPSISYKKQFISSNYPISTLKIAVLDFFGISLLRATNWVLFFFVVVFSIASKRLANEQVLSLFIYWVSGLLASENFINAITWKNYFYLVLISLITFIDIAFIYTNLGVITPKLVGFIQSLSAIIYLAAFFGFYQSKINPPQSNNLLILFPTPISSKLVILVKILFNNERFRLAFLFSMLMKAGFLILFLSKREQLSFPEILEKVPFVMLFETPVILFTYLFNNLWGYFWQVQFNTIISNGALKQQVTIFLSLLLPVLIIDILLTLLLNLFFHVYEPRLILVYLVVGLYAIILGVLSSFRKYFFAFFDSPFSNFRAKTSTLFSFFLLLPVTLLGFAFMIQSYFLSLTAIIVAITMALILYINAFYQSHYLKFKKLFFETRT